MIWASVSPKSQRSAGKAAQRLYYFMPVDSSGAADPDPSGQSSPTADGQGSSSV